MNPAILDTLESIISRFPAGKEASKIRRMLTGKLPFCYEEVRKGLENIRECGGSEKVYTRPSDKEDCEFYLSELDEAKGFFT